MLFATCSSLVRYVGCCVRGGVCPPLRVGCESFSPISRSLRSVLLILSGCALLRVIYMNYSSWVFKVFCLSNLWSFFFYYNIIGRPDTLIDIGLYGLTAAIYRTVAVIDIVATGTVPSVDISATGCYYIDK